MPPMQSEVVLTILAMAAATYLTRIAGPVILGRTGVPAWLRRFLNHVPTAMLAALIAPALFAPRGAVELTFSNHYLLAGLAAAVVAYRRLPPVAAMAAGMAVMLTLRLTS